MCLDLLIQQLHFQIQQQQEAEVAWHEYALGLQDPRKVLQKKKPLHTESLQAK